jgi:predicted O-linked N-acetylglucosamine transferase (SPINDLY family)/predicted SAM-dependent methyltransferase
MNWISRLLSRRGGPEADAERARLDEWMREGYEHHQKGRSADAGRLYRKILESDPGYADASYFLGVIAQGEGRNDEAVTLFRSAVAAKPDEATFLFALGTQYYRARRFDEAVTTFRSGLAFRPGDPDAQNDLGASLMELGRLEEALAILEPLVAANGEFFPACYNLANLYRHQGRIDDAIAQYRRAIELRPDHLDSHCCLLFTLNYSDKYDADTVSAEHRRFGERHARAAPGPEPDRRWPRKLRIGYLSPDFRSHVVASFIGPALARHDREKFELFCYYTNPEHDEDTARLRSYAEHWSDCAGLSDNALADRIRGHRIDILVDLAGHTSGHRIGVLAMKPAPVQVTYLGYPNTTGLPTVDYRITDAIADPPGDADTLNVEQLLRLPRSFLCYRPGPDLHDSGPLPALRNGYVTFGCFNNFLKLSDSFLDAAALVLKEVPGSRLVLKGRPLEAPSVAARVQQRFAAAGVAPERLELRGWTAAVEDHLGAYREIDIALDSFPYNGTTTTCEAVWMGVPVVTLQGDRHAARVGASLLNSLGLVSLVARNVEEFVRICARLATDLEGTAALRAGLRDRLRASPLMDEAGFTRELERCYQEIWMEKTRQEPAEPNAVAEPLRLHIGGKQRRAGWKILNILPGPDVDYVGDCSDLSRFADGSVDEIYASHVLEHLGYQQKLPQTLAAFHRLLRKGGRASISVPDFEVLCRLFLEQANSAAERFHLMRMAFGGQIDSHDFHCVGLTAEFLADFLAQAGFSKMERVREFGLFDDSSSQRFHDTRISLNVIAYK